MPTKEELEAALADAQAENAELRDRLDEAGAAAARTADAGRPASPRWETPSFGLSEGERADLEANGVTRSAFTGETLFAGDHGVTPATDEARKRERGAREIEARRGSVGTSSMSAPAAAGAGETGF